MKELFGPDNLFLEKGNGSCPSGAELKPLDIYLESLDIPIVHRRVALWHKS